MTNSRYGGTGSRHAPASITKGGVAAFTYGASGNMPTGLGGKIMTYDGENRRFLLAFPKGQIAPRKAGGRRRQMYGSHAAILSKTP